MNAMDKLKETYDEKGYVVCDDLLTDQVIEELRAVIDGLIDNAPASGESDNIYEILNDVETGEPRIERINEPHKVHRVFDQLIRRTEITDVLRTLLGPNVRLQDSKLNLKLKGGSAPVEWHQDWAFYPHTNDDVLAVGVMIDDMTEDNGPIMFVPGSHRGPVYEHMSSGVFCGAVAAEVSERLSDNADTVTGRAGSVTFHHARLLHASQANRSGSPRRFLLYEVMAADAWPLAGSFASFESWESMNERMVIGEQSTIPRLVNVPVRIPLPLPTTVTSIFQLQKDGDNKYFWEGTKP